MRPQRALYALLFAVHPVLWLYVSNRNEVRFADVVPALLVSLGFATLLLLVWTRLLRDSVRAALLTSLFLVAFFTFGHVVAAWSAAGAPGQARLWVGVVWGVGVVASSVALVRTRRRLDGVARFTALVALVLVGSTLVSLAVQWRRASAAQAGRRAAEPLAAAGSTAVAPSALPDIYYIVVDGYARHDTMRDLYGYDNVAFLERLRQRGFQVSGDSRANYCKTLHALASTLNMQYLHEILDVPASSVDSEPLIRLVRSNRTVHMLRERGYSIVTFASGYDLAEFSKIDHYLDAGASWSEFANVLLATTPLPWVLGDVADPHARHRRRLEFILDGVAHVRQGQPPRFVFAHLLAPHPPFVFDRDGRALRVERPFGYYDGSDYYKHGGTREEYVAGYAEQARWVTTRLEQVLVALLQRYGDQPPIIFVQSDHGPGSRLDWKSVPDTDLDERFGILMAAYLPGRPAVDLGDAFSPVNIFRLVFDVYFGASLAPLEHHSYYTFQSQPFHYIDVTNPEAPTAPRRGRR